MSVLADIETDLLAAVKSGDQFTRDTLRYLKSVLKNAEIEARAELSDDQATSVIQKEVKRRVEAEELYKQAAKPELAQNEAAENKVLKKYLPSQMSEAEVKAAVTEFLAKNPTQLSEMGKAMGQLSGLLKGKADMGVVSKLLREQIQPN